MHNRLQELRWEKDWSQTQLAMKSNVSHSTISLIENNTNNFCIEVEQYFIQP